MMTQETAVQPETFESFKKSFFYGSRSDLSFKFLSHLSDDQAASFLHELLSKLVDAHDSKEMEPVFEHIRQGQMVGYAGEARAVYDSGPFTLLKTPVLSAIPVDTPMQRIRVRHGGYDVRGAQQDPNVSLPLLRLRELSDQGGLGDLSDPVYSFVGACAQTRLLKTDGPAWMQRFKADAVDAALKLLESAERSALVHFA